MFVDEAIVTTSTVVITDKQAVHNRIRGTEALHGTGKESEKRRARERRLSYKERTSARMNDGIERAGQKWPCQLRPRAAVATRLCSRNPSIVIALELLQ